MPLTLQGEGRHLLFPRALHVSGQGTKPPKPRRAEIMAGPEGEPRCPLTVSWQRVHHMPPACGRVVTLSPSSARGLGASQVSKAGFAARH